MNLVSGVSLLAGFFNFLGAIWAIRDKWVGSSIFNALGSAGWIIVCMMK